MRFFLMHHFWVPVFVGEPGSNCYSQQGGNTGGPVEFRMGNLSEMTDARPMSYEVCSWGSTSASPLSSRILIRDL